MIVLFDIYFYFTKVSILKLTLDYNSNRLTILHMNTYGVNL